MFKNKISLLKIYFMLFYMGIGIYSTYITVFFKGQGLNDSEIGTITGVGPVVAILGLTIAGRTADRLGKLNLVLSGSFLLSALCALVVPISDTFLYMLCINTFYTFATSPLLQLSDALAADCCAKQGKPFNGVKLCGTAGYAIIVLASGYLLQGREKLMFVMIAVIFFVSAFLSASVPDNRVISKENKHAYSELFKDKALALVFVANFLIYIPVSYYNSFFPIFIKELANDSLSAVAWSNFLALISEFPFLLTAHILCKKFGHKKILMTSCALMTFRWVAISLSSHVAYAAAFNLLKGASDIVFTYCTTALLNQRLADRLKGTGQALIGILNYSFARIIGNYAGGILSDIFGIRTVFAVGAVFPLVAFFLLIAFSEHKKTVA